jgi:hypothetical protein
MKKETFALIAGLIRSTLDTSGRDTHQAAVEAVVQTAALFDVLDAYWQCDFCGSRIDPDNDQDWYGALFSHADASDRFVRNQSAAYCGSCLAINVNLKE